MDRQELLEKIEKLRDQLAEAEAALPAHSVRPQQMQRVMQLEEQLEQAEQSLAGLDE